MLLKDNTSSAPHQTFMQKKESGLIPNSKMKKPIVLSKLLFYKYIIFFVNNKKKRETFLPPPNFKQYMNNSY